MTDNEKLQAMAARVEALYHNCQASAAFAKHDAWCCTCEEKREKYHLVEKAHLTCAEWLKRLLEDFKGS